MEISSGRPRWRGAARALVASAMATGWEILLLLGGASGVVLPASGDSGRDSNGGHPHHQCCNTPVFSANDSAERPAAVAVELGQ